MQGRSKTAGIYEQGEGMHGIRSINDPVPSLLNIDRVVHEPARFIILANLYTAGSIDFRSLVQYTGLTQGNLSSHMTKLEKAGYIVIAKEFAGRRPRTLLNLTSQGRSAFTGYRDTMKTVIDALDTLQQKNTQL